ncbi:MAG: ribosome maturation factor RimP, partial [Actinobacteria bacterium]|nr:ribosome maturation factor RimP [Actinomycetota bacterium]
MTARFPQAPRPDPARHELVVALLEPAVSAGGLELEDLELRSVGRRLVLRVLVDSDRGVTLDEIAAASRAVSEALDGSDVLGDEPYTLEVTSPGVDRPLTAPRHWRRNVGRLVAVTLTGGSSITGRITSVSDAEVMLEVSTGVKGTSKVATSAVALVEISRAVVQVDFSRTAATPGEAADDSGDSDDWDDSDDTDDSDD